MLCRTVMGLGGLLLVSSMAHAQEPIQIPPHLPEAQEAPHYFAGSVLSDSQVRGRLGESRFRATARGSLTFIKTEIEKNIPTRYIEPPDYPDYRWDLRLEAPPSIT